MAAGCDFGECGMARRSFFCVSRDAFDKVFHDISIWFKLFGLKLCKRIILAISTISNHNVGRHL